MPAVSVLWLVTGHICTIIVENYCVWCFIGWCTCVCIHVVLLVAHYQFGVVFPSDVELQNMN